MFCPRCGSQINAGLKFCKSCGLPVAQISTYVATGGTGQLVAPPTMIGPPQKPDLLTPKQEMAAIIILWVFAIPLIAIFCAMFDFPEEIIALPAITLPLGIIGATGALLISNRPFGFVALLGMIASRRIGAVPHVLEPRTAAVD